MHAELANRRAIWTNKAIGDQSIQGVCDATVLAWFPYREKTARMTAAGSDIAWPCEGLEMSSVVTP